MSVRGHLFFLEVLSVRLVGGLLFCQNPMFNDHPLKDHQSLKMGGAINTFFSTVPLGLKKRPVPESSWTNPRVGPPPPNRAITWSPLVGFGSNLLGGY